MTTITERATPIYGIQLSAVLIMIGLLIVGLNLEFYVRALELSSTLIPDAPNIHFFAPQEIAAVFAVGAQTFDLQPIIGMLTALLLFLFGPALLIAPLLRDNQQHPVAVCVVTYPLFFLYSLNTDWLFVQFLQFDGLRWLVSIFIFSVFAAKISLSLATLFSTKGVNPLCRGSIYLTALLAPLGLLVLKSLLI